MIGSTCSEIEVIVSKTVLSSVVTDDRSTVSRLVIRCGTGTFGEENVTRLPANTDVASIAACAFAGIKPTHLGSIANVNLAFA